MAVLCIKKPESGKFFPPNDVSSAKELQKEELEYKLSQVYSV